MLDPIAAHVPFDQALFRSTSSPISSEDASALLEQYKIYVDCMEKAVSRRQTVHTFFLTANSFLVVFSGALITKDFVNAGLAAVPIMLASVAGVCLSLIWMKLGSHYRLLNVGKFQVIHALEQRLPSSPFRAEWEALGRGLNPAKYQSMAGIEGTVSVVFLMLYGILFVLGMVAFIRFFH